MGRNGFHLGASSSDMATGALMIAILALSLATIDLAAFKKTTLKQSGTGTNSFLTGTATSNTVSVAFPIPYVNPPLLVCCPFTPGFFGLRTYSQFWSTNFVSPQIANASSPTFDKSAISNQNNSTCSPCTNKVTITPSGVNEVLLIHLFYVSDVTITVTSVTAAGLSFIPIQPFGAGSFDEIWETTVYTTSPIVVTVTFSAPGSTLVTTSVVATLFGNTLGVSLTSTNSASSFTSPITVANPTTSQYGMIVGNSMLEDAGIACHDPTPGSGQTQILNANTFCATNTNGGTPFLYNYDVEYFSLGTAMSYNYVTNFNGTISGTGLSINVLLLGGVHHDKVWTITSSNSTLYNSEEYDIPLNPSFSVNSPNGLPSSATGSIYQTCNYASANVSITFYYEIFFASAWLGLERWTAMSGSLCQGGGLQGLKVTAPALDKNYLSRIRAICSCVSVQLSIANLVIGWTVTGQIQIRESFVSITATGFTVKWLASEPAPQSYVVNWQWTASGN